MSNNFDANLGIFTQTDDTDELKKQFHHGPLLNPAKCTFVSPRKSDDNPLKVEPDITLTKNFLDRGVNGFIDMPIHLRDAIFLYCESFHDTLTKAYVACIKLYHIQSYKGGWNDRLYNLKLPDLSSYLKESLFVAESEDIKAWLTRKTSEHITQFASSMYTDHLKRISDHATVSHATMLDTFDTYQSYVTSAAWCELHDLKSLSDKEDILRILQESLDYVCKFAFPEACKACSALLDDIINKLEFQPGETYQVQLRVPLIDEDLLFKHDRPVLQKEQALPPTEHQPMVHTPGATKPVCTYLQYVLVNLLILCLL